VQQQTQSVPIGGENCGWNSNYKAPQSDDIYALNASSSDFCEKGQQALRDYHFTYLNNRVDVEWISKWKPEGCWDEVQKNIGYRFDLEKVEINGTLNLGGTLNIDLWVTNHGYAKLYKERDVEMVFTRESTTINIPVTWPPGRYELGLRLPDPENPTDPENPWTFLHSIRFANSGWNEETGTQIFSSDADKLSVLLTKETTYVITAQSGQSGQ